MKKLKLLLLLAISAYLGMMTSCEKDAKSEPTVRFTYNSTITSEATVNSGTTATLIINVNAPAGLKSIVVKKETNAALTTIQTIDGSFDSDTANEFNQEIQNITVNTIIHVIVTDKDGNAPDFKFTFTVNTAEVLNFWSATLMGAQGNATYGSAFSTTTGLAYLQSANFTSNIIDFIYYYKTDATGAEMISPKYAFDNGAVAGTGDYLTLNETKFKSVSVSTAQFDAITKSDETVITDAATGFVDQRVTALGVNSVFAFQTAAGKLGLAKVTALTATTSGTITIEVKVQK